MDRQRFYCLDHRWQDRRQRSGALHVTATLDALSNDRVDTRGGRGYGLFHRPDLDEDLDAAAMSVFHVGFRVTPKEN